MAFVERETSIDIQQVRGQIGSPNSEKTGKGIRVRTERGRRRDNQRVRGVMSREGRVRAGGWEDSYRVVLALVVVYHPPRLVEGEEDPLSHVSATSAASSLALLVFLPSYQNLALSSVP
jgi:hypothetical protein